MPAPNHLNSEQKRTLQKALKEEDNAYIRERILILLLLNDGKTQVQISELIGCSLRTVSYWCSHGDANNLDSLKDKRMEGNYRKATEEYIKILLETIDKNPQEMGYEFGRWTAKRLATYLTEQTGIELSSSQVTNILKKKKYVYIWAKYSLEERQDPEKRKEFKQKLAEYLKIAKEEPDKLQIWFWDGAFKVATQVRHTAPHESGFSLRVIRRKVWGKKGRRTKVSGQRRSGRVNVMGGVRYSDKKRFVEFIKKGTSETFYEVIKGFYQEIIKEWVEAGNKEEDFREKGPKIVLILDNASIHKKADIVGKIAENMPNLILEYLPAYSPDLNLIELVWHSAKEFIAHRLFKSVEELESQLHQLLNEGGLIIKWDRKLKNKGNSVNAI